MRAVLTGRVGHYCLLAAVVVAVLHPFVPAPRWLMIHLLLLGAAGHAIVVWSRYFAETLLRLPTDPSTRRGQCARLALYDAGVLLVVVGMVGDMSPCVGHALPKRAKPAR